MTPYFKAFLTVLAAIVLGVVLATAGGCASAPAPKAKADAPFVSVFIFADHCDGAFLMAAFTRSDGSIVETADLAEAKTMNATITAGNGRIVPVYNGPCKESM